jgi:hypothetical protein
MNLLQAANGHLLIEFGELSDADWQALEANWLMSGAFNAWAKSSSTWTVQSVPTSSARI